MNRYEACAQRRSLRWAGLLSRPLPFNSLLFLADLMSWPQVDQPQIDHFIRYFGRHAQHGMNGVRRRLRYRHLWTTGHKRDSLAELRRQQVSPGAGAYQEYRRSEFAAVDTTDRKILANLLDDFG